MQLVISPKSSPYFNLSAEEYLLKSFQEDFVFLYINTPSVIIGKHQNTLNEVNYPYVKSHGIDVVRRISGGGTVYHDHGNINFCFIQNGEMGKLVDFKRQTLPIIGFLNSLGVKAEFKGHNDLRVNDYKISGNAEHVFKQRVLHHGTLLFNSKLTHLDDAIKIRSVRIEDKAVKSVRASVKNICEFLPAPMSTEAFYSMLAEYFEESDDHIEKFEFSDSDLNQINKLIDEKFSTWEWNYGYSPGFKLCNSLPIDQNIDFCLHVKKGVITDAHCNSENEFINTFFNNLVGIYHTEDAISPLLQKLFERLVIKQKSFEDALLAFF